MPCRDSGRTSAEEMWNGYQAIEKLINLSKFSIPVYAILPSEEGVSHYMQACRPFYHILTILSIMLRGWRGLR